MPKEKLAELHNLDRYLQVCDKSGRILGYFTPATEEPLESPLTEAELQERTEEPWLTTAEVLAGFAQRIGLYNAGLYWIFRQRVVIVPSGSWYADCTK